jgi:hypothetical protein
MGYEHLFEAQDLALLYDWLQETSELYMDLGLLSRICGAILAPGVVPDCDTGQFP